MRIDEEYTCAICNEVFTASTPEDEALEELQEFFGDVSPDDCGIVCDTCWQKIRPDKHGIALPVSEHSLNN